MTCSGVTAVDQTSDRRLIGRCKLNQGDDLSERTRQRAAELAHDADLRVLAPRPSQAVFDGQRPRIGYAPAEPGGNG